MRDTSGHTCHTERCDTLCAPDRLFCPRHWRMVPREIQRAVWAAYRPGQCDDMRITGAWFRAAQAAIAWVAVAEGIWTWAQVERMIPRWRASADALDARGRP